MNKNSLHIVSFLLVFTCLITFFANPQANSEVATSQSPQTQTQQQVADQINCDQLISTQLQANLDGFYEKVQEFLNAEQPVSTNLVDLQYHYLNYRSKTEALRSTKIATYREEVQSLYDLGTLNTCDELITDVVTEMELVLSRAVAKSTSKKSALPMVSKFDQINIKLEQLVNDVNYIADQISAFNSRVPCYIESCIR